MKTVNVAATEIGLRNGDIAKPLKTTWCRTRPSHRVAAVALVLIGLIYIAPDTASAGSKTKFLALGTVQLASTPCSIPGCDAPKGHCECVSWDGLGQAQVSGIGTIKEVGIGFLINLDSCVESPSLLFGNCCPVKGVMSFIKNPGPVEYRFNLSDGTVCESQNEFSYKATFQVQPSRDGSTIKHSGTVPTVGEFEGIAPIPPNGHIQFFMR
jgi:hypothetical protein